MASAAGFLGIQKITTASLGVTSAAEVTGRLAVKGAATFDGAISAGSTVTGFPISSAYNASAMMTNARVWVATASTTSGQAAFFPTSTNSSGGVPLFRSILSIQSNVVLQTALGSQVPYSSIYSQSPSSIIISAVASGVGVPNGTKVFCLVVGL